MLILKLLEEAQAITVTHEDETKFYRLGRREKPSGVLPEDLRKLFFFLVRKREELWKIENKVSCGICRRCAEAAEKASVLRMETKLLKVVLHTEIENAIPELLGEYRAFIIRSGWQVVIVEEPETEEVLVLNPLSAGAMLMTSMLAPFPGGRW